MASKVTGVVAVLLFCGAARPAVAQTTTATITFDGELGHPGGFTWPYGPGITVFHPVPVPPGPPVALVTQMFSFGGFTAGVTPIAPTITPLTIVEDPLQCAPAYGGPACVSHGTAYLMTDLPFSLTRQRWGNFSFSTFAASQVFGGVPPGGSGQADAATIEVTGFRGPNMVAQETFTLSASFQTFTLSDPDWLNVGRVVFRPRDPNGDRGAVAIDDVVTATRPGRPKGDFDGDGRTDLALYRAATGTWYIARSSTNFTDYEAYQWGAGDDIPAPGDYDGDGRADIAVYRPGTGVWFVLLSSTNHSTYAVYRFGAAGDIPVPGDYDGDGADDIAIYRKGSSRWFALLSSTNFSGYLNQYVASGGKPLPADYDNDGRTDLTLFYTDIALWIIWRSSTEFTWFFRNQYSAWLLTEEMVTAGDYDGDGRADFGFFRPDLSLWRLWCSALDPVPTEVIVPFGLPGDQPLWGDYDGDGIDDIALYRPGTGDWYIATSSSNFAFYVAYRWGMPGDVPIIKP